MLVFIGYLFVSPSIYQILCVSEDYFFGKFSGVNNITDVKNKFENDIFNEGFCSFICFRYLCYKNFNFYI